MYPEEDLGPAEERLALFLMQYWGGPTTYSDNRGHPRLRMRHAPFTVDRAAHDAWLKHMRVAVDELGLSEEHEQQLWNYLTYAAASMVNTPRRDRLTGCPALIVRIPVVRPPKSGHDPVRPCAQALTRDPPPLATSPGVRAATGVGVTALGAVGRFVLSRARAHRLLLAAALLTVLLTTAVLATLAAYSGAIGDAALRHSLQDARRTPPTPR